MGNKVNILIVEDNPADRLLLEMLFDELKDCPKLHFVENGIEAIEFLENKGKFAGKPLPDLVLLDLNLPQLNGLEVLEKIKNTPAWRSIPVVMLTSSSSEEDIKKSYNRHANSFITKPNDLEEFQHIVHTIKEFWVDVSKLPPGH